MKYSPEQQRLHVEKVYAIMKEDMDRSIREICRQLEDQGLHLSRPYVSRLLKYVVERVERDHNQTQELIEWHNQLLEIVEALDDVRFKLRDLLIWDFPIDVNKRVGPWDRVAELKEELKRINEERIKLANPQNPQPQ